MKRGYNAAKSGGYADIRGLLHYRETLEVLRTTVDVSLGAHIVW